MFEEETPTPTVKSTTPESQKRERLKFAWKSMPVEDLICYMDEIRQALPPTELSKVNLEEELMLQFQAIRALQATVLTDESQALNQRAQVANAVQAVLTKLIEMQEKVYNQERYKAFETIMIRCLSKLPEDRAAEFLEDYERMVRTLK